MVWVIIIFTLITICLLIIYSGHLEDKWYKRGYDETYQLYSQGKLGNVENTDAIKHFNNENKWYHKGAYDAYKEIMNFQKNVNNHGMGSG